MFKIIKSSNLITLEKFFYLLKCESEYVFSYQFVFLLYDRNNSNQIGLDLYRLDPSHSQESNLVQFGSVKKQNKLRVRIGRGRFGMIGEVNLG